MTHELEDLPNPSVEDVDQRQTRPGIPVTQTEPLRVQLLPSRTGSVLSEALTVAGGSVQVLYEDNRRRRAVLVADSDWLVSHSQTATASFWPARVPLVIEHAGPVWAAVAAGGANLTIIPEFWAD
jgi:hypothetical protein